MPGPKSDKIWSDAIRKHVHAYHETKDENGKIKKQRYLNVLAANLINAAVKGDMQAMKEVGDRLDGKPSQALQHSGEVKITKITEEFVMPDGERYQSHDEDAPGLPTSH